VTTNGRLARALAERLRGETLFDDGTRALYATDASNYRQVPLGVVRPRDAEDVAAALEVCRAFDAPVVGRGGGTSLAGQGCNTAVVIDFSRHMNRIVSLDPERRCATVEPGVVLDALRARAEEHHLTFGPDPSTHSHCTLGGMIGNNSCGVHALMAGCTASNVEELEVLTYEGARFTVGEVSPADVDAIVAAGGRRGEIHRTAAAFARRWAEPIRERFPDIPRRVSGYNLPALAGGKGMHLARALVGSEGTLVTVLQARVRLVPSPPERALLVLGFADVFAAADAVVDVLPSGPIGLEGIDQVLVEDMTRKGLHPERVKLLPDGKGWLLVEFGGETRREAEERARDLMARLGPGGAAPSMKLFDDRAQERTIWKVRESGLGATARVPGQADTWEGWEDAAVAPEALGAYLRDFRRQLDRFRFRASLYGHFGQGCVHTRIPFDLRSRNGIAQFRSFVTEAADLVVRHGGSLSGEHGDGQSRAELLPRMFGPDLIRAFEEWKGLWDPSNRMNPGKIVRPNRLDENLRLAGSAVPTAPDLRTRFRFPDDKGSFGYAMERCVGVGNCRQLGGGTMCPSFMATQEERHSTRGRARLLYEMVRGEVLQDGWRSGAVREALDLCLSCKSCKGDCPVNVDMASYKAEFLSHHYRWRLRPRSAYAFGLAPWSARLASLTPGLVNRLMRGRVSGRLFKRLAGVAPERTLPSFAPRTFHSWWGRRRPGGPVSRRKGQPSPLLWIDTWSNHFEPEVAIAAVEVLERAGFEVAVPGRPVCCGRPLYDYGMLDLARRTLRRTLAVLRAALRAGTPVVVLEPSCLSVFRDELRNLFPHDIDARRLRDQSFSLQDFLLHHAPGWSAPRVEGTLLVQPHCHHRAVLKFDDDAALYRSLGAETNILEAGCCGMAGAFGYERPHHGVSVQCAERALLPAVRSAPQDALVIADGFSCRSQIAQLGGRRALHTAQVLASAATGRPGA
jgi:FAD/FMN-containing dehydrogenase/Fe-S oxidoreductase